MAKRTSSGSMIRCSDCTAATAPGARLKHDMTCPVGWSVDRGYLRDCQWFADHPGTDTFFRAPYCALEVSDAYISGAVDPGVVIDRIGVVRIGPGTHSRMLLSGERALAVVLDIYPATFDAMSA